MVKKREMINNVQPKMAKVAKSNMWSIFAIQRESHNKVVSF